jgi:hypothetical protein
MQDGNEGCKGMRLAFFERGDGAIFKKSIILPDKKKRI